MLSANTVAQKPGGSVIPPLSPAQGAAASAAVPLVSCAIDGGAVTRSIANIGAATAAQRTIQRQLKRAALLRCVVRLIDKPPGKQNRSSLPAGARSGKLKKLRATGEPAPRSPAEEKQSACGGLGFTARDLND